MNDPSILFQRTLFTKNTIKTLLIILCMKSYHVSAPFMENEKNQQNLPYTIHF